jgi:beta-lactamase regulating signal transducer with metallopeptidase domain
VVALAVLPLAMALLPAWHVLPKTTTEIDWPILEPEMRMEAPPVAPKVVEEVMQVPAATPALVPTAPPKSWRLDFSKEKLLGLLPVVWLSIAAVMLLRLAWSAWRLHRLERSLNPATVTALNEISREIGLKRVPRLLLGAANAVPMVWGVWWPRLLLPAGFESWTADKLRGVLLHELAHLKRGDPLALWTAQWVKALHWFNPLAWLTIRQLRADQERACDDAVLRHGVRASDYAQHLLDLSRHTRIAPGLALCALTITRCAPVEARVKAILDPKRHREALTTRWLLGLAGFALLTTLPVAMLHAIEGAKLRGRILDRNGVVLAESTPEKTRHYPLKTLAAHMLGYTRMTDPKDPTPIGHAGIEKQQDAALAAGKDVTMAFDMRIQSLAHRAMYRSGSDAWSRRGARSAHRRDFGSGFTAEL